jgi:3-phosphoshikimate 1-carboxyvinyltransferase
MHISHIGHIRLQESDRIHAIVTELRRIGIRCEEEEDTITIYPGIPHPAAIETYEDHRMAMAFSLLGLRTEGITIRDPMCCKKTFEDYFKILDELTHNTGTIKEDR